MDTVWVNFFENILLAFTGLAIYSIWQVRTHLDHFKWSIFWNGNKVFWAWAFSMQVIFAFLIAIKPEAAEAIKNMTGIDYSESMAFITSGAALAMAVNMAIGAKQKIGPKKNESQ